MVLLVMKVSYLHETTVVYVKVAMGTTLFSFTCLCDGGSQHVNNPSLSFIGVLCSFPQHRVKSHKLFLYGQPIPFLSVWLSLLLLHYCSQILPEEYQLTSTVMVAVLLLGLSPYGRVPEVQSVNFDFPQADLYLQSIQHPQRSVLKHCLKSPWDSIRSIRLHESSIYALSNLTACFLHSLLFFHRK